MRSQSMKGYDFVSSSRARTHHAHVVHTIGREIVSGAIAQGEILPGDADLMARFRVSRTVLREAMKTLADKGLVLPKARIGTRVREKAHWRLFDADVLVWHAEAGMDGAFSVALSEMRLALEPEAAALAAGRRSAADLDALKDYVAQMAAAKSSKAFVEADYRFHTAVAAASGNPFMHSLNALIEVALVSLLTSSSPVSDPTLFSDSVAAHQSIADAIAEGDAEAARQAMRRVIRQGIDVLATIDPAVSTKRQP